MNRDDDVRRSLERMAAETGFSPVDPAPVLRRAYRRLARTVTVLGVAGVTVVAAITVGLPGLFHALPGPARVLPGGVAADPPNVVRITCLGDGHARLQATTVAVRPDGLHVAIVQDHPGARSHVFIRLSGWLASVGFSDPGGPRFRTVSGVNAGARHTAIGCFDSPSGWPDGPEGFHRLTLVAS